MYNRTKSCIKINFMSGYLLIFWSMRLIGAADIDNSSFLQIVKVEGEALYWSPMLTEWKSIKVGDRLFGEPLIQTKDSVTLVLKRSSIPPTIESEDLTLNLNKSIILRLHRQLNREVILTSFSLNVEKRNFPFGSGLIAKASGPKKVPSAWERVKKLGALLLNISEEDFDLIKESNVPKDVSLTQKDYALNISVPVDGSLYMVESFPAEIPLVWGLPKGLEKYPPQVDIHIEDEQKKVKKVVLRTTRRGLPIVVPKPGIYKISVSSTDAALESESISISVESNNNKIE